MDKVNKVLQQVDNMLENASNMVFDEVIKQASQILLHKENKHILGFCMAMGSWHFSYKTWYGDIGFLDSEDSTVNVLIDKDTDEFIEFEYGDLIKPVVDLIDNFDNRLCITGNPVKIDLIDGGLKIVYDW